MRWKRESKKRSDRSYTSASSAIRIEVGSDESTLPQPPMINPTQPNRGHFLASLLGVTLSRKHIMHVKHVMRPFHASEAHHFTTCHLSAHRIHHIRVMCTSRSCLCRAKEVLPSLTSTHLPLCPSATAPVHPHAATPLHASTCPSPTPATGCRGLGDFRHGWQRHLGFRGVPEHDIAGPTYSEP